MTSLSTTSSVPPVEISQDERREWIRIDDRILMEYRIVTESGNALPVTAALPTAQSISEAVAKPTAELLARSGESVMASPMLPWIMKVDYLLEVILNSLAASRPETVNIARLTDVNLSGGGVGFAASQEFVSGDHLMLKLILPPFTPIQTTVRVIRSEPLTQGQGFMIATEFIDLKPDDQEHLIRHILQTQAERLRSRRKSPT
ncbi:MAG: PilZ domain-containing protein [Nitrospira sp.]|nr:PilZ domain-containing protein [Nitrospira sp.]MBX3332618.1 PilZ domain-containing protein [Nitrospira sp.]MDR4465376.1 PilZ domain-containing protein [Nitrospira sp.]